MTYLLVCALCAGSAGSASHQGTESGAPTLAVDAERDAPSLDLRRDVLASAGARAGFLALADHSAGDGHSGHDDGAHVGPMWIMMGVMMVGMMVALGAYMMRGHWATPLQAEAAQSPHLTAIPPVTAFRPGG